MNKTAQADTRYGVTELVLILVALALVGFTTWYVRHATTTANNSYSITESSQIPSTPKKAATN